MQLVDLETFKTKKCELNHPATPSASQLHCPFFHSREDKRRSPFANSKTALIYTHTYVEDFYSTQMASNLVEYLFHPNVYKTIPCKDRLCDYLKVKVEAAQCLNRWCPYIHQGDNLAPLEPFRHLPMLIPIEEDVCHDLDQVNNLNSLLKGDRQRIKVIFGEKIDLFKEHLRKVAAEYQEKVVIPEVAPQPQAKLKPEAILKPEEKGQKQNWYTEYTEFYFSQKLPLIEDRHHEFKNYWDIINNNIAPTVMKYIAAFLNSDGGVLYVGIDDNSVVNGFELTQQQFDRFLLSIDSQSKLNMLPPLMPHKYSIRRIPVIKGKKSNKELWVLEVKVTPSELDKRNKVLTLYNREAFMRMNASTHKLDPVNIIEYLRHHEEERQDQKTRTEILDEFVKSLERKDKPMTLQQCAELKGKLVKAGQKLDELMGGLRRREGERAS